VCCRSLERISESHRWGRRSCKQLSDTVTERKNLLPNSDHRAERDCSPTYSVHSVCLSDQLDRPDCPNSPTSSDQVAVEFTTLHPYTIISRSTRPQAYLTNTRSFPDHFPIACLLDHYSFLQSKLLCGKTDWCQPPRPVGRLDRTWSSWSGRQWGPSLTETRLWLKVLFFWCYTCDVFCVFSLDDEELASLQESLASDILSAPVPSTVPSPSLMPSTQRPPSSLIRFDSLASIQGTLHNKLLCLLDVTKTEHCLDVHLCLHVMWYDVIASQYATLKCKPLLVIKCKWQYINVESFIL